MDNSEGILIHALAIHRETTGTVRARVTLRMGDPALGDRLWFEGTDRVRRELEIVEITRADRLSTVTLSGAEIDLQHLVGGTYLYGIDISS